MKGRPETITVVDAEDTDRRSDVERAARDLAAALAQTPEFEAFERAYVRFRDDARAQEALSTFQQKQRSLQAVLMLGAASAEERAELERLREAWVSEPTVMGYLDAQTTLASLSRAVDQQLSEKIGLRFAASCRPSCCG